MMQFLSKKLSFFSGYALLLVLAPAVIATGCSGNSSPGRIEPGPQDNLIAERTAKDQAFRTQGSPIPPGNRAGFDGLSYYPVNPDLRFTVRLNRYPSASPVRLATNTGEIRSGLRYGYFEFEVEGESCRLQVYRLDDSPESGGPSLFIPFRDATSGKETYGSGRYIDLKENTSGIYDLDLNRAYNPYCAYNPDFSCPIPPAENTLKVAIRAGEKLYSGAH